MDTKTHDIIVIVIAIAIAIIIVVEELFTVSRYYYCGL
jgi:hypothetical protein